MGNKKAIIYCFSGTGNTFIAAKNTAKALSAYDIETDIFRVRFDSSKSSDVSKDFMTNFSSVPNPNDYDIALFSYPIYAFNTPWFFLKFVKGLPSLESDRVNTPAFIFKTSGEPFSPNGASSYTLVKALKKKGFRICSDIHMLMPYNIMFRYPDAMVKQMYIHTESMAEKLAKNIADMDCATIKFNYFWVAVSYILRLQHFGAIINGPFHKVDAKSCISCGKCIGLCPASNIYFVTKTYKDEKGNTIEKQIPKMGSGCQMCMACTLNCPKASINPGFLTPWKVNPGFDFERIIKDESIPSNWTDSPNAKYFKLFRNYYKKNPLV